MFAVYKGEIKYFDESGNLGDPQNGTSNFFVVGFYIEHNREQAKILVEKIKKHLNLRDYKILKWNKFDIEERQKFSEIFTKLFEQNTYFIYTDKRNIDIFGEDLYKNMLYKIIKENNLQGRFNYDGDHLYNMVAKVRKKLRTFNVKSYFENVETEEHLGIQIADLCAGYLNWCLENQKDIIFNSIIRF